MSDQSLGSAVWLFILIWLAVWVPIIVVGAVVIAGWLAALGADWLVAVSMWVTGQ